MESLIDLNRDLGRSETDRNQEIWQNGRGGGENAIPVGICRGVLTQNAAAELGVWVKHVGDPLRATWNGARPKGSVNSFILNGLMCMTLL